MSWCGDYKSQWVPRGHPLSTLRSQTVGAHRVVLFDKIGPGVHPCEWCGTPVAWHPQPGERPLEVDHVDHDGLNNAPANLVASCRTCNGRRARSYRACEEMGVEWTGAADQTDFAVERSWIDSGDPVLAGPSTRKQAAS